MTSVDELLAGSLLLSRPHIPEDTVPDDGCGHPFLDHGDAPLWEQDEERAADTVALRHLTALCETALYRSDADDLSFITDRLPAPHAAWILGCALLLAGVEDGARYWWQYAAAAENEAAVHCLQLHHLARGDRRAADFWRRQARAGNDLSVVLRLLCHPALAAKRDAPRGITAVMNFVAATVAQGYADHPGVEIPVPGDDFAHELRAMLAARSHERGPARPAAPTRTDERRLSQTPAPDREYVLQVPAGDRQGVTEVREEVAGWRSIADDRATAKGPETGLLLCYRLNPWPAGCAGRPPSPTARRRSDPKENARCKSSSSPA
ncbi:hypothetical protein [Streptomyces fuscigenes]|uniref:hypothetical protein n=1 Tax=Streptomyces fuscigenes TaxID=1528880 RepID=UPI001F1C0AE2|nr:hypothetical protein [Streptomyces fuscigenes]MCF3962407.1 hypothetical protein [Streptomyces fuscigenes]